VDVYFNTSRIFSGNTNVSTNAYRNTGGSNIKVKNNNFANFGNGRAYWNDNLTAITESDYNNLFTAGKFIARWGSNEQSNLSDLQIASNMDGNSLNANPWFLNSGDPGINSSFLDGSGLAILGLTTDFFNTGRLDPPDIGAAEFTSSIQALATGTYTVGGDSPDYATLIDAFTDLQLRGVSGQVTLNIRTGDYDEHVGTVNKIPGASAENFIVVKSETGNPEDVRIYQVTDGTGGPFNVINLKSVDYFTLRDITVSALGNSAGRPLSVSGTFSNVNIINTILTSSNTYNYCVAVEGVFEYTRLENNLISGGYGGIYFYGESNDYGTFNSIVGNTMTGGRYYGIFMKYQYSPMIVANNIENSLNSGFEGIKCELCADKLVITRNRINNDNSDYGIHLVNCDASNPFFGLVSNNMVRVGGSYSAYGIYLDNCTRTFIYNNSINITSTHASNGNGIYTSSNNSEIEIINNVVANTGIGRSLYIADMDDVPVIDFNDLYTGGENLVYANSAYYTDLASWQAASSLDANSISSDPLFYSESDLRSLQIDFHQTASPLPEVTVDIDSVPRDLTKPDLGASELYCETPDFNIYTSEVCFGDTTIIIDSTLNIARGSSWGWDFDGDGASDIDTAAQFEEIQWLFDVPGTNTIIFSVEQIAGCRDFTIIDVFVTPEPELEIISSGAYCGTEDGSASVSVTNLSGPFEYYWSNGSRDSVANELALGTYTIAVSTPNGCVSSEEVVIGEDIDITVSQINPSTCGIADGTATVIVSGGTGPYTYVWSNGETEETNSTLPPGPAYVNVIDSEDCSAQGLINIESDGGPQISRSSLVVDNECYGVQEGAIDIEVSGGVAPYNILWSNGMTTEDIDQLGAGTYNVVIEDAESCLGAGSFQVNQPARISVSPLITPATCKGSDGNATAIVSGGIKPYAFQWSTGGIYQIEEGMVAGVYSVTVTDGRDCKMVEPVIVNNIDAPVVTITDVQGVGCTITDNGSISASASPLNPFYSYSWSNGAVTPNISGLTEGTYVLTVTDEAECVGVNQAVITQTPPDDNPICLVTVDTLSGKNMILWEKLAIDDVSHYNVYRESSVKSEYSIIGSVEASELGFYIDSIADPSVRSWRYKISVVDDCGIESELSDHHKTMHLTMNVGLSESVNLIWDHYEGFDISTYNIWRYDAQSGWSEIASMPSNLTSYTDQDPPNEDLTYYIEVMAPNSCIETVKKPTTLNVSRSNRKSSKKSASSGGIELLEEAMHVGFLKIYPNPGSGQYNLILNLEEEDNITILVYDISGKMILNKEYQDIQGTLESKFDLSAYSDGIYQVHVKTKNGLIHRILIKEN
jgi:hypothetical protein